MFTSELFAVDQIIKFTNSLKTEVMKILYGYYTEMSKE